jgi:glycosyltransferase involved in cell wall biosynthesis
VSIVRSRSSALYKSDTSDHVGLGPVCVVVPAYNEAGRIGVVLETLRKASKVDEIIVVDDGSKDGTAGVVGEYVAKSAGKIRLVCHPTNLGKGAAMRDGAEATQAPVIVFFDADLIGLTAEHVDDVIAPVADGRATMALGVFRGGRGATTLAQILAPNISGQRAIRRDVFLRIPELTEAGYGVELAITNYVLGEGLPVKRVVLWNVSHPMKEEKLGFWRGTAARVRMYHQMMPQFFHRLRRHLTNNRRN